MRPPGPLHLSQLNLAPGQEWTDESRAWRILRLEGGGAYWLDAVNPRALVPGELVGLAPRVKAVIRASQLGEAILNWFCFDPHLLCGFFTVAERHWIEGDTNPAASSIQFFPPTHSISIEMAALVEKRAQVPEVIQRGEALLLALRLLTHFIPQPTLTDGKGAAATQRFCEIISRMQDSEFLSRTSEDLARLCGCTPRHFNRIFRAHFGESPRARQTELRLLKARQLLHSSDEMVAQIATQCGYRSLSLFNSLFKRRFGMSPTEWRQSAATGSIRSLGLS